MKRKLNIALGNVQNFKRKVKIMRYMANKYGVRYALRYRRTDQYWAG